MKLLVYSSLLLVAVVSYASATPPEPYGVSSKVASFSFGGKWKGKLDVGKDKNGEFQFKPEADKNNYFTGDWGYESKFVPFPQPSSEPPKVKKGERPASQESASARPKQYPRQNKPAAYGGYPDFSEQYGYGAGRPY